MREKKKLGKGLGALLSAGSAQNMPSLFNNSPSDSDKEPSVSNEGELKHIPLDQRILSSLFQISSYCLYGSESMGARLRLTVRGISLIGIQRKL